MFIGFYNVSIILTFLGLFCSVLGISFSLDGNIYLASILMILSGICDCFDGYVASLVKRNEKEKLYGVQLDSLVDVCCFGVFPIILAISLGYNEIYNIIIYFIYLFCGVTRLAYFNVDEENKKYFKGVPITTVSFLLPILLLLTVNETVIMLFFVILSFLFLYNIKINKIDLKKKKLVLVVGLILVLFIIWRFL